MSNEAKLVFTGDAEQIVKEFQKLEKANAKQEAHLKSLVDKNKAAGREEQKRLKEAAQANEKALTPAERYNQTLGKYKQLLQEGRLSQEKFNRLRDQEIAKLNDAKRATDQYGVSAKKVYEQTRTPLERYNAKVAELNTLLRKGKIDQDTFNRGLSQLRQELHGNNRELAKKESIVTGIGRQFLGMASSVASATTAVRVLIAELEKMNRLQDEALGSQVGAQKTLSQVRANFTPDAAVNEEQFDERVRRTAKAVGVPVESVAGPLGVILSAKGSADNEFAFRTVEAALKFTGGNVDAAAGLVGAVGDFRGMGGASDDPEAILGFMAAAQTQARGTSVAELARSGAPAINAMVQAGGDVEGGMELFTTLTRIGKDPTGRTSGTAMISLIDQLMEFEELEGDIGQRLEAIQSDREMADRFLAGATFERKAAPGIRALVRADPEAMQELASTREAIPTLGPEADPVNVAEFRRRVAFIAGEGTVAGNVARRGRQSAANIEAHHLASDENAVAAQARKILSDTLASIDLSGFDMPQEAITGFRSRLSRSPEEAIEFAEQTLQGMIEERRPFAPEDFGRRMPTDSRQMSPGGRQELERESELLQKQLAELGKLRESIERSSPQERDARDDLADLLELLRRKNQPLRDESEVGAPVVPTAPESRGGMIRERQQDRAGAAAAGENRTSEALLKTSSDQTKILQDIARGQQTLVHETRRNRPQSDAGSPQAKNSRQNR